MTTKVKSKNARTIAVKSFHEFSRFYFESDTLKIADSLSEVPENDDLDFCTVNDAICWVQKLGCSGISQHTFRSEYHRLCLEALRYAVQVQGEIFPVVYRGVRSDRADSEYKILFGSRDREVASFYGSRIKEYQNVRGILVQNSRAKSVKTNDWSEVDDEIIFFPDSIIAAKN